MPGRWRSACVRSRLSMHVRLPRDLQEVCQFQRQFAPATPIPVFGGTRGPEVAKSISDIQASMRGTLIILGY